MSCITFFHNANMVNTRNFAEGVGGIGVELCEQLTVRCV